MTTFETPPIDFPSEPISGQTKDTVQLVATDWRAEDDWFRFQAACRYIGGMAYLSGHGHLVNPNLVREHLTNPHGLTIEPKRYSSFWSVAAAAKGRPDRVPFLDRIPGPEGWTLNTDVKGGNRGKPLALYRLRAAPTS